MRTLILDTETTDLISNRLMNEKMQPRIIEFYGNVVEDDGTVVSELEFLCNPGFELQKITTDITGLRTEDVADAPPFSHFAPDIQRLLGECDAVAGHNLAFDFAMIEMEMQRCGIVPNWPAIRICTVQETEWYKGHRLKQGDLYELLFNERFEGAHRAKADVKALTRIWVELRRRGDV